MDFRVGADQRELAQGIRAMVAGRLPLERIRAREGAAQAVAADDWAALGETGVFALTLPEPAGTGLGLADAVVLFEELGRALVPGPLVGTFLAASDGLVAGAAEGRAQVGVCDSGGPPFLVEHLGSLDALLVLDFVDPPLGGRDGTRRGGSSLITAIRDAPGAAPVRAPLDPLTPLWHLAALPAGRALDDSGGRLFRAGSLLTAALQVGHAAETLDLAVAYAKQRQQFGKPIGTFQAVKHMCADMLVRAEVARTAVQAAACLSDDPGVVSAESEATGRSPGEVIERAVMGAKLLADEAALANARTAIQVHGGMGYTWEVPLHLHLKRSRVLATTFGTPARSAGDLAAYV
jgi:alkylation response protein AidB-like acyl-CoA dehydrogenase